MKSATLIACLCLSSPASLAMAQHAGHGSATQHAAEPVNVMCPIGAEPIDGKTFVQHEGKTVGFCCPGCDNAFMNWEENRRSAFVLAAMRGDEPGAADAHAANPEKEAKADPYLLDTCPVSGQKLGSMGEPLIKTIEGREVRFCCGGCVGRFEADTAKYFTEMDKAIAKQQMPYYPLDTCVVTGEPLAIDGEDIAINHVYKNRLVRLCCKGCVRDFEADPAKHMAKLDDAVIKVQRADYPLETCAVLEGSKLGSMGKPVEIVVANRLVKFCCGGCQPSFEADPAKYMARLDEAWKPIHEAQGKLPVKEGHKDGDHGQDGHGDHGNGRHGHGDG